MAKCDYCGKSVQFGIKVSHSHRRSNRTWKPNVKRHSLQSVCLHTLPAFRQGYARCLIFFKEKNQTGEDPGFFLCAVR